MVKKKLKATELKLPLKELVETEGVNAAAVISRDGILVNFFNTLTPEDISLLSPVVAMMTRTAEKCTKLLKKGHMKAIITRADGGMIITEKSGEFIFLVAVDKGIDFESLKLKREKVKAAIRSMV